MKQLKDYLGDWKYTHASGDKYFRVVPRGNIYFITWGDSMSQLQTNPRNHTVDAPEAFRRIRAKARGGYVLVTPYAGEVPASANLSVEDLYSNRKPTPPKVKEPKKRFSFTDWLGGDWDK